MYRSCKCLDVELSNILLIDVNPAFTRKVYDKGVITLRHLPVQILPAQILPVQFTRKRCEISSKSIIDKGTRITSMRSLYCLSCKLSQLFLVFLILIFNRFAGKSFPRKSLNLLSLIPQSLLIRMNRSF